MTVFVILHYLALEETKTCVESILHRVEGEKRIVLVDNASPNGSGKELRELYRERPEVTVIATDENLGFARGNNFGYRYALEHDHPDFVVVMNNDMEIRQPDFIARIESCYERYGFAILGPDIYSTRKRCHQNPQTRTPPTLRELKRRYRALWIKDKLKAAIYLKWRLRELRGGASPAPARSENFVREVVVNPLLHGSCYVFSRGFLSRHPNECFYSKTFMYLEAEILYYQAIRDGEKMVYCPALRVEHHEDVATDAEFTKQYQKSIFTVRCLLQSTAALIELMERDGVR